MVDRKNGLTYADSGVDIDAGNRLVDLIKPMVRATARDFATTARLGDPRPGGPFVFEGDEYTTSALDPRAKFLHWEPQVLTLLNLELDHPDIYPDLDAYTAPYRELVAGLPASGWLLYNAEDALVAQLAAPAMAQRESWGLTRGDWVLARRGWPTADHGALPGRGGADAPAARFRPPQRSRRRRRSGHRGPPRRRPRSGRRRRR